jgi:BirA family biotin operon repressor/biotin-[acetyl-CoA-carboxylase] ligase
VARGDDGAELVLPAGYTLFAHDEVTGTNDVARDLIKAGTRAGAVVWARSQTAGRGRHGRVWDSPSGNLYGSVVLEPEIEPARLPEIALVAALAVRDCVCHFLPAGISVTLKWPNDVLADGRKIAGILCETESVPGRAGTPLILGVGINVVSAPTATSYPATSLAAFAPAPKSSLLLANLLAALDDWYGRWRTDGFALVRETWIGHAHRLGALISTECGVTGVFRGVDETGAVVIGLAEGGQHRLAAGTIRYL